MHYFFLEGQALTGDALIALSEEDINHAYRVLRLKAGDEIAIADGLGQVRRGRVAQSSPREVLVSLHDQLTSPESPLKITLFQSLVKGDKMDLIIRQAVELGVHRIVPVITARSIPQREKEKDLKRLQRWRNIVRSASAQCRRAFLAQVEPVLEFGSALSCLEGFRTLVPWEEEKAAPLSEILKQPCPSDRVILFFIGPEGGFTSAEIEALRKAGAITVNLGPRIMRSETAAAAVAVMVQAAWGDLSGEGECR